jgi:protein-tyrosine phosphatase
VIDLHCHILPGVDDGAGDMSVSLEMARTSVAQGVTALCCTPHILPGLYHNSGPQIRQAVANLQQTLDAKGVALQLVAGADVHMTPDFVSGLRSGRLLSIADSRYVLVEPPHHSMPPHLEDFFFSLVAAGYVPVLTHPERLSWAPQHYEMLKKLVRSGVWMQVTAGSLAGTFGRSALYWACRMLDEGYVHLIATDAHDADRRPPDLAAGRDLVAKRLGADEAEHMVATRPDGVLKDRAPSQLPLPLGIANVKVPSCAGDGDQLEERGKGYANGRDDSGVRGLPERLRRLFKR